MVNMPLVNPNAAGIDVGDMLSPFPKDGTNFG